jgi:hypothetical protein
VRATKESDSRAASGAASIAPDPLLWCVNSTLGWPTIPCLDPVPLPSEASAELVVTAPNCVGHRSQNEQRGVATIVQSQWYRWKPVGLRKPRKCSLLVTGSHSRRDSRCEALRSADASNRCPRCRIRSRRASSGMNSRCHAPDSGSSSSSGLGVNSEPWGHPTDKLGAILVC